VSLAEGTANVSVGGVVRSLEADEEVVNCDEPAACPLRHACRLRRALWQAQEAFYASLDEVTIGDLTRKPSGEVLLSLGRDRVISRAGRFWFPGTPRRVTCPRSRPRIAASAR
jgi:Rrf2 family nitric oxide-sensitive transcriptional repressor